MDKYIGQPCISCNDTIKEDDEIVVCPECGSPYHKSCYAKEGKCINIPLHENGETWQPDFDEQTGGKQPDSSADGYSETIGVVCPNCNTANSVNSSFCSNCGRPLNSGSQFNGNPYSTPFGVPFGGNTANAETDVDGNTIGEYSRYLGFKSYYFLPKFMRFAKNKSKFSFNFSAFLFPHYYFLYRKMNLVGYIVLAITTLLSMPYVMLTMAEYGMFTADWVMSDKFIMLCNASNFISNIICVLCGILANWAYYRKAKSDIGKIKAETSSEYEQNEKISTSGGTSALNIGIAIGVQMISVFIIMTLGANNFLGI